MKLKFVFIVFTFSLFSCINEEQQKERAKIRVEKEWKTINTSLPDQFPLFNSCDETATLEVQQECFYNALNRLIQSRFSTDLLEIQDFKNYKWTAQLYVSAQGELSYKGIVQEDSYDYDVKIDSLLRLRLSKLPSIKPALKQGQPISSWYKLPVIIVRDSL